MAPLEFSFEIFTLVIMAFFRGFLVTVCAATATVLATPTIRTPNPAITLDRGTFIGIAANGVNEFRGIPFAQPPFVVQFLVLLYWPLELERAFTNSVGDLRFRHPQALGPYDGIYNATAFGLACPQQEATFPIPNGLPDATLAYLKLLNGNGTEIQDGEDCEEAIVVPPPHGERL